MEKQRWSLLNNPFGFELPKINPIIHPIINTWEDFSEEDKVILSNIKKVITSYIGDCKLSIFGSRVKGNWTKNSDYDIVVFKHVEEAVKNILKNYEYGVEVDISFVDESTNLNLKIEIQ